MEPLPAIRTAAMSLSLSTPLLTLKWMQHRKLNGNTGISITDQVFFFWAIISSGTPRLVHAWTRISDGSERNVLWSNADVVVQSDNYRWEEFLKPRASLCLIVLTVSKLALVGSYCLGTIRCQSVPPTCFLRTVRTRQVFSHAMDLCIKQSFVVHSEARIITLKLGISIMSCWLDKLMRN